MELVLVLAENKMATWCFRNIRVSLHKLWIAVLFFIFTSLSIKADAKSPDNETPNVSIYHIDPWKDGSIIGLSSLGSLYAYANSGSLIHERCPCDPQELNSWDRSVVGHKNDFFDHLSDVSVSAALAFPVALDWYDVGFSKEFAEDMTVYAETLSVNGALVTFAKYTTQRPLPRTYEGDARLVNSPRGYRSFYSGHTSLTFAALSTASMTRTLRHGEDWWPWILTGVIGTSVGYERILAGRHFYTDVIMGAVMGTAVGIAVPRWHHQQKLKDQSLAFMPVEGGAVAIWKMQF